MTLIVLWSRGLIEHFTHLEDTAEHEPGACIKATH
jgi:Smg protein